jgi:hypothetical protein
LCVQVAAVDLEQALPDNQAQPQKKRQAGIAQTSAEYIAGPTKNLRESQPLVAAWQESRRTGEGSKRQYLVSGDRDRYHRRGQEGTANLAESYR